jgi:hypothetical protein
VIFEQKIKHLSINQQVPIELFILDFLVGFTAAENDTVKDE